MGFIDTLLCRKPKPKKTRRPRRVVLVSPKGRRLSFPPSARAIHTLEKRGWKRAA